MSDVEFTDPDEVGVKAPVGSCLGVFAESMHDAGAEYAGSIKGGTGGRWTCPVHEDEHASLDAELNETGGTLLFNCFPCEGIHGRDEFLRLLRVEGVEWNGAALNGHREAVDWGTPAPSYGGGSGGSGLRNERRVARYVYRFADGSENFRVDRYEDERGSKYGKTFRVARHLAEPGEFGEWESGIKAYTDLDGNEVPAVRRTPYLWENFEEWRPKRTLWVVEGEKTAQAIVDAKGRATCFHGGAGIKHAYDVADLAEFFGGFVVYLAPDCDRPGLAYMARLRRDLESVGVEVGGAYWGEGWSLEDPACKGLDAADWIEAGGKWKLARLTEVSGLLDDAGPEGSAETEAAVEADGANETAAVEAVAWTPVNLKALRGTEPRRPEVGHRSDGAGVFYAGLVNQVFGESEAGKTWLALIAARDVLADGGRVVMLDAEDDELGITQRLEALGLADEDWERFAYYRITGWSPAARDSIRDVVAAAGLVLIDATTEFLALMGLGSNDDTDIATFYAALPKWCALLGPAVVVVDHVPKDTANRNGATGSQHKKAGLTGVSYYVAPKTPMSAAHDGGSRVLVNKDKAGRTEHVVGVSRKSGTKVRVFADLHGGPSGFRLDAPDQTAELAAASAERAETDRRTWEDAERVRAEIVKAATKRDPITGVNQTRKVLRERRVQFTNDQVMAATLAELKANGYLSPEGRKVKPYRPRPWRDYGAGVSAESAEVVEDVGAEDEF